MFGHGIFGFGRGIGYGYGLFGGYGFIVLMAIGVLLFFLFRRKGYNYNQSSCASRRDYSNQLNGDEKIDPLEVLKLRYAKGEISEEDYQRIKKMLME